MAQISDCGSQNGTLVNGSLLNAPVALRDGDVISIGPSCQIVVRIGAGTAAERDTAKRSDTDGILGSQTGTGGLDRSQAKPAESATPAWLTPPFIASSAAVFIILVAVLIILVSHKPADSHLAGDTTRGQTWTNSGEDASPSPSMDDSRIEDDSGTPSSAITIEKIERTAKQVMRRISNDDKPYVFQSASALDDIKRKVEEYRATPGLPGVLRSMSQRGSDIVKQARSQEIEPDIVIYAALADIDGGRAGADPVAAARSALPRLLELRVTFGTEQADKSLLLVAGYRMGPGTKQTHPLLSKMEHIAKNATTDRNIWFGREHGAIDNQTYEFVLSFLALGIIAQSPSQFGVAADPLPF
jgi:pSer/pThr/pTyr-binding forkhead associated (FHA) protein